MNRKFTKGQIIMMAAGALVVVLVVLVIIFGLRHKDNIPKFEFSFWGIESLPVYEKIIADYQKLRPNITVKYRQVGEANYENDLINALAAGQGPDIFMVKNSWLLKHRNKIFPLPENQLSFFKFQQIFPNVVSQDFTLNEIVYAAPLSIDSLVLYYNKNFFDQKSVALAPTTWQEFLNILPQLRELNYAGEIVKSAAALGGSTKTISRATDILKLLMFQKGASLLDPELKRAVFNEAKGKEAFDFYTKFANPASPYYTWSDSLANSLNSFSQENTAIIFDYYSEVQNIKAKNPFLNFAISPMLQFDSGQAVNFAKYWGYTVAAKAGSLRGPWAWDFILFMTVNDQVADMYLTATKKPPALRTLINNYINDPDLGIFAKQALTSRSGLQPDDIKVDQIFSEMIASVINGRLNSAKALQQATDQVTLLLKQ